MFSDLERSYFFAGDVSKESAVLGWIVENTKDEDDPTENKKKAAEEERKRGDAGEELQGPRKIRTPKQEARYLIILPTDVIFLSLCTVNANKNNLYR